MLNYSTKLNCEKRSLCKTIIKLVKKVEEALELLTEFTEIKEINGDDLEIYIYNYSISYGCVEVDNQMYLVKGCWRDYLNPLSSENPSKGLYLYSVDEKID